MEKKLDSNYTRMLRSVFNKSWKQHPTKQQLYGYQPPITKTIQIRRTRHVGHCWRSKDELISDVLLRTPSHERANVGRPARTCIQQLCADTRCSREDLPEAIEGQRDPCWQCDYDDIIIIIIIIMLQIALRLFILIKFSQTKIFRRNDKFYFIKVTQKSSNNNNKLKWKPTG